MVTRVAIVGAGNVATHLVRALVGAGAEIVAIASRHIANAAVLACEVGAKPVVDLSEIPTDVDFVIISVSDSAVAEVAAALPEVRGTVVHTSGSVPLEKIAAHHHSAGVLYPLQTFSRDVAVDISKVPFFTEAADDATLARVDSLAGLMSGHVYHADSAQRARLHIAGVLSSNFVVYLLDECRKVIAPAGFPLSVVEPLVRATLDKTFAVGPHDAMTGPARRGDLAVVEAQASRLPGETAQIYRAISRQIYKKYNECD